MADQRTVLTGRFLAVRPLGGSAEGQASPGYPLGIIGHLVPEDGRLLAGGAAAWGGFPAAGSGTSSAAAGWT
jgi:hypothetical protein